MTNKIINSEDLMRQKRIEGKCELCGVIATPYGGLLRLKDGGILHMECAMRYSELRIRDVEEFVAATGEI